ncbi:MAG: chemotaxis response regulator protein-glutamate methylesterase [Actinobacteria bacterium]|nr:chemotaxis response regulator protein-glutamate methylesterase [Actinomycetota bacterium]
MPSTIKVLIVDDSALIRQMLTRALSVDPRIVIVGTAKTGVEAISQAKALSPDVITMDIEMPELTGLEALPHIKKHSRARVIMLSTLDDPDVTYEALSLGAVDFLAKPKSGVASSLSELSEVLLKKIRTAARIDPIHLASVMHQPERDEAGPATAGEGPTAVLVERSTETRYLVGVAASTGGPPALERMFSALPASLPASYLIVQHLPQGFSASLARRLSAVSEIEVVEALDGMPVEPGWGYLAPYGRHMVVENLGGRPRIRFNDSPPMHGVCPSADPLFYSLSDVYGDKAIGVILTGMGADGAAGLGGIREAGGVTIAQDEATSVVWGMPGVAVKSGAARYVVPVGLLAAEVRRAVRGGLVS